MYAYAGDPLKHRLIWELRDIFASHPVYSKAVPYIQGRHSFKERPEFGIVVTRSSVSGTALSADNFLGTLRSHVMLAQADHPPVFPIEWVREDDSAYRAQGRFITPPGLYWIRILRAPLVPGESGELQMRVMRTVTDEVVPFIAGHGSLLHPPLEGMLRLYHNRIEPLTLGEDYVVTSDGFIQLKFELFDWDTITADYRYLAEDAPIFDFKWDEANTTAIPGVVLAFGDRAAAGQSVVVVVYDERVDAASVYGGKGEVSFDLEVLAKDTKQAARMADFAQTELRKRQGKLGREGIELVEVSQGGESEDVIDETGQNFQYTSSLSVQLRADWEYHEPLPLVIHGVDANLYAVPNDIGLATRTALSTALDQERLT